MRIDVGDNCCRGFRNPRRVNLVPLHIENTRAGKPIGVTTFERHLDGNGTIPAQDHARR